MQSKMLERYLSILKRLYVIGLRFQSFCVHLGFVALFFKHATEVVACAVGKGDIKEVIYKGKRLSMILVEKTLFSIMNGQKKKMCFNKFAKRRTVFSLG